MAELAMTAGSRADAILPRMVQAFGWNRERGRLAQQPAIERHDEMTFVAKVTSTGHPYRTAWNVLTTVETGWRNLFVRRKRVQGLLTEVRRDHPELEMWFNADRVVQWERGGIGAWRIVTLTIFFLKAPQGDVAVECP